jgi:hypothetical protein
VVGAQPSIIRDERRDDYALGFANAELDLPILLP